VTLAPSHFTAVVLFAGFASIIFGITQRSTPKAMVRYGVYCFVLFLVCVIAASWIMYFIRH
jgi:preprotein translocase subunit SecG